MKCWMRLPDVIQLTDGLILNFQDSFIQMSGAFSGMMGRLGLAETFHQRNYTWPHLHILRVVKFRIWRLAPKKLFYEKWVENSLYNIALGITDCHFCHILLGSYSPPLDGRSSKKLQPSLVYHSLMCGHQLFTFLPFEKYTQCLFKASQSIISLQSLAQIQIPDFWHLNQLQLRKYNYIYFCTKLSQNIMA